MRLLHVPVVAAALLLTGPVMAAQTLTIAAFPAVDDMVRAAIPLWKEKHPDVDIKVVSRQFSDHHTAMMTALSTSFYLPDIMVLEVGYVGRFAQGNGLEDLSQPPFDIGQHESAYVPYAYQQARGRNGAIIAAPSDIGPGALLYRADLLQQAGVSVEELTRSWDDYLRAGEKIKAATGAHLLSHAHDIKDIMIRTGLEAGEGLYFDENSNVLVTSRRFVRAFELAREVRRRKLDAKVLAWSNEWSEGFRRGGIATQMSGAWLAGHMNNWLAPSTRGKWRSAQLPEKAYAAFGGAFYAIARGSPQENKKLAWEFIRLMTLDARVQLQSFKTQDAFPALVETYSDPFFDQPIAFLGGQAARQLWREAATRIKAVAVHKQDSFADEVINTELDKVLERDKDIDEALADAARLLRHRARR